MELTAALASPSARPTKNPPPSGAELVLVHTALVYSIAAQVRDTFRVPDSLQDLFGYGCAGLLDAATRYRPESPVPFVNFAYHRIRGEILDGLRRQGWQTRGEYAARLKLEREAAALAAPVLSVEITEASAGKDGALALEDALDLRAAVSSLPELERAVLERYYFADETLPQIATALGVTKSWTCRLHARGIELLRARLGSRSGAAGR